VRGLGLAIMASAVLTSAAIAQSTGDTAKYQPTILNLRACIRANAPPAYVGGIRTLDDAFVFLRDRCFAAFSSGLTALGAADAATGSFRLVVRDEWVVFMDHINSH
jgi:hypothetical protein